jgi:hypothetical protein
VEVLVPLIYVAFFAVLLWPFFIVRKRVAVLESAVMRLQNRVEDLANQAHGVPAPAPITPSDHIDVEPFVD